MKWKFLGREAKSETVRNAAFDTLTLNNQDKKIQAEDSPFLALVLHALCSRSKPNRASVSTTNFRKAASPVRPPRLFLIICTDSERHLLDIPKLVTLKPQSGYSSTSAGKRAGSPAVQAHPGNRPAGISPHRYHRSPCPARDLRRDAAENESLQGHNRNGKVEAQLV